MGINLTEEKVKQLQNNYEIIRSYAFIKLLMEIKSHMEKASVWLQIYFWGDRENGPHAPGPGPDSWLG